MIEVFFATKNKDKIIKMQNRLKQLNIKVITPYDINVNIEIDENGSNVIENATLKAKEYFNKVRIPTIATDSSLYVEKFDVQPGLFIKRINGVTLSDDELEEYYINELNRIGGTSKAFYITGLVLVQDDNVSSIEIKEDEFIFTSNVCPHERNFDPLSRLEFDEKIGKYFCELDEFEINQRGYNFDKEARKFIKNNIMENH